MTFFPASDLVAELSRWVHSSYECTGDVPPPALLQQAAERIEYLTTRLSDANLKDGIKTNEINILTRENRELLEWRRHWADTVVALAETQTELKQARAALVRMERAQ